MLWIDPDGLRTNGAEFHNVGEQAQQTFEELRAALAREGRCWGDDEPGKAFEQNYLPDAERGLEALEQLAAALQTFGQQLNAAADSFEQQDQIGAHNIGTAPTTDDHAQIAGPIPATPTNAQPIDVRTTPANTATPTSPLDVGTHPNHAVRPDQSVPALLREPARTNRDPVATSGPGQQSRTTPAAPPGQQSRTNAGAETRADSQAPASAIGPGAGTNPGTPPPRNAALLRSSAPSVTPPPSSPRTIGPSSTATPWASGARPAISAMPASRPPNTPWSNGPQSGAQAPWQRGIARSGESQRGKAGPHRPPPSEPRPTPRVISPRDKPIPHIQRLIERHHLECAGFDTSGLVPALVQEFAAAVDTFLTYYPVIAPTRVVVDHLAPNCLVRVLRQSTADPRRPFTWHLVLNVDVATQPARLATITNQMASAGSSVAGTAERPVFVATLRELGSALDIAGNHLARNVAQRALISEYLLADTNYRRSRFTDVVRRYKRWRDQLCGHSFDNGCFNPPKALAWAFADVVVNGPRATEPAKVLHRLLVDTAWATAAARRNPPPADRQTANAG
ncbi:hypothetical protein [Nocardia brasiliensis]|uniref:hypothetical protein n=1 Tax=Nocardia brasiliensis TaxID=37326 RepID=UPI0024547D6A|nr:hypothetical protein [Nocardia brasiliensis]